MTAMIGLLLTLGDGGQSNTPTPDTSVPIEFEMTPNRDPLYCGVQAACLLSHLYRRPVAFEKALGDIPVTGDGSSLASLERCLARNGLKFQTVLGSPALLEDVGDPFIAHFEPTGDSTTGHYVVVLAAGGGRVLFVDPSWGSFTNLDVGRFCERWSGHALVPTSFAAPRGGYTTKVLLMAVGALCMSLGVAVLGWPAVTARFRKRAPAVVGVAALMVLSSGCANTVGDASLQIPALQVLGRSEVSLGYIPPGGVGEHVFSIRNLSPRTQALAISDVSCACAGAELDSQSLAPGDTARLTVVVRSDAPGLKTARVTVNATSQSRSGSVDVRLEAVIGGIRVPNIVHLKPMGDEGESETVASASAVVVLYTSERGDGELLEFVEQSPQQAVPLECTLGNRTFEPILGAWEIPVPAEFRLPVSTSSNSDGQYRECAIQIESDERPFHGPVKVYVEPLRRFWLQPAAVVLKVREQPDGTATGRAVVELVSPSENAGIAQVAITTQTDALTFRQEESTIVICYSGPALGKPTTTDVVVSSPVLEGEKQTLPVLLVQESIGERRF